MKQDKSLVSIIIPTKNSSRTIEACLKSCKDQTYPNIEIIVVDNFSTDRTEVLAKIYTDKVYQQWPERTTQKNLWITKAKWEYVFFVDSDMELCKTIVSDCLLIYKSHNNIWGICIPEHSVGKGLFVKVRDFERTFYSGTWVESARFFMLNDVIKVWWFEEDLIFFEESLLPQKIESQLWKSTAYSIDSFIDHHEWNIKIIDWLQKKFYYGQSLRQYQEKIEKLWIKKTWQDQINIIGRYLIFLKKRRFYTRPLLAFGVIFLKTMEFGAGWLGILQNIFISKR